MVHAVSVWTCDVESSQENKEEAGGEVSDSSMKLVLSRSHSFLPDLHVFSLSIEGTARSSSSENISASVMLLLRPGIINTSSTQFW